MLRPQITLLTLAALLTPLSAQAITVTGKTKTLIGAFAETTNSSTQQQSIPAGTSIQPSVSATAKAGGSHALAVASVGPNKASFVVNCTAAGTSTYGSAGTYTNASSLGGEARVTFRFATPTKTPGRLVAVMKTHQQGFVWGALSEAIATVRVPGYTDGVCDSWFDTEVTREFALDLDHNGVEVEVGIECDGSAQSPMSYGMTVEVVFVPGHKINAYGVGCAHLHSSSPGRHSITLHTTSAMSSGSASLFALGFQPANGTLGGPLGCPVYLQPFIIIPGPTANVLGEARLTLPLPNDNFRVYAQGALYMPFINLLQTTNGLELNITKR